MSKAGILTAFIALTEAKYAYFAFCPHWSYMVAADVYEQKSTNGLALQTDMEDATLQLQGVFCPYQACFGGLEQLTGQDQELQERSEIKAAKHL